MINPAHEPFHFGRLLFEVVRTKQLESVLYMGSGCPLLSSQNWVTLKEILAQNDGVVVANNYYSADVVGFSPGSALGEISLLKSTTSSP